MRSSPPSCTDQAPLETEKSTGGQSDPNSDQRLPHGGATESWGMEMETISAFRTEERLKAGGKEMETRRDKYEGTLRQAHGPLRRTKMALCRLEQGVAE